MITLSVLVPVYQPATNMGATPPAYSQKTVKAFEAFVRERSIFFTRTALDCMTGFDPQTQHAPAYRRYDIVCDGEAFVLKRDQDGKAIPVKKGEGFEKTVCVPAVDILVRAVKDFGEPVRAWRDGEFGTISAESVEELQAGIHTWCE